MAREWGEVPEYRASLASTLGEAGGAAFLDEVQRRADEMAVQARTLFEGWLRSAGVPVARARFAHRAPLTSIPTTASTAVAPGPSGADPGYAWQHGLYWLASNVAVDSPLALVVDDLQWCDAPSARALAFVARRLEGQPLALILATQPLVPP